MTACSRRTTLAKLLRRKAWLVISAKPAFDEVEPASRWSE